MVVNTFKALGLKPGSAICYSGFRNGQHPGGVHPNYKEVKEDLLLLSKQWKYIRLYDCDEHAHNVLQVITDERLDIKVMLSAYIVAEVNNHNCPWGGGVYPEDQLKKHKRKNERSIQTLIDWSNKYESIISSLSVGNEACVDWTDHLVPVESVIQYVKSVQSATNHPVTFCENYVPWLDKLQPLAEVVDFISIHTYPVWEYKSIAEALAFTQQNYYSVANKYPNKPVVITEAGWATQSNGQGIPRENVNEEYQKIYIEALMKWVDRDSILTYVFEAFDEKWKGSPDPLEPEKHWGLYTEDRIPKLVLQE